MDFGGFSDLYYLDGAITAINPVASPASPDNTATIPNIINSDSSSHLNSSQMVSFLTFQREKLDLCENALQNVIKLQEIIKFLISDNS